MYVDSIGRLTQHIDGGTPGLPANPWGVAKTPLLFGAGLGAYYFAQCAPRQTRETAHPLPLEN